MFQNEVAFLAALCLVKEPPVLAQTDVVHIVEPIPAVVNATRGSKQGFRVVEGCCCRGIVVNVNRDSSETGGINSMGAHDSPGAIW